MGLKDGVELMLSKKVVTPVKTGVQCCRNALKSLDSGACPGPDPGFTGMTILGHFRLFTRPSRIKRVKKTRRLVI